MISVDHSHVRHVPSVGISVDAWSEHARDIGADGYGDAGAIPADGFKSGDTRAWSQRRANRQSCVRGEGIAGYAASASLGA